MTPPKKPKIRYRLLDKAGKQLMSSRDPEEVLRQARAAQFMGRQVSIIQVEPGKATQYRVRDFERKLLQRGPLARK